MDTDFGLLLYIDRNFLDPNIFNVSFFNSHHTIKDMIRALIDREHWNPLTICVNEGVEDSIVSHLYNDFMNDEKHREQILELSMYTKLCDFIKLSESSNREVRPTILCKYEMEKYFIKRCITKSIPVILLSDFKNDIQYQQFFFKHLHDGYADSPNIEGIVGKDKTIYLANYEFNIIDKNPDSEFFATMSLNYNQFKMYDLYNREDLKGETSNGN